MTERFDLLERVGRGGMGVVWRARDTETGEILALKLVHDLYADDPDYLARLDREVETAQRIDSPHVVRVIGHGRRQGVPFIAMEFVEGESVRERLERTGPMSWTETANITRQVLVGLDAAHRAKVLHRDIKPGNILISKDGVTKLADFGIAKATDMQGLTGSATMLGTPAYMAPDGVESEQSDLYALGCVVYEMLTGSPPFSGSSMQAMIAAHYRQQPDFARVPTQARAFLGALLEKDPATRPGNATAAISLLVTARPATVAPSVPVEKGVDPSIVAIVPGRTWGVRPVEALSASPAVRNNETTPSPVQRVKYSDPKSQSDSGSSAAGAVIIGLILVIVVIASSLLVWDINANGGDDDDDVEGAQVFTRTSVPSVIATSPPTATPDYTATLRTANPYAGPNRRATDRDASSAAP